jgi:DMSO/TMAO reductase YedYZ molybdopterin-dependent catalytic subunit
MPLFRSKAEDKVRQAGFDPARLPPGQYFTEKWPVLHAGEVPHVDIAAWTLELTGEVEQPVTLSYEQFRDLPATEITTDIHCVTRWSRFDAQFRGVHWRELAKLCRPKPSAHFVIAHAEHGFTSNVPLEALEDENALIVYEADREPLTPDHGYPVRLFIPTKYFWKSAKWLRGIELSAFDKPGFWERYGYHNNADFWQEQRYGF